MGQAMDDLLLKVPDAVCEQALQKIERARWAAALAQKLDRAAVQHIVRAVADAAFAKAQVYADAAVRETAMGVVAHKRLQHEAGARGLLDQYGGEDFVSPRIDAVRKIVELPRPAGVIFALTPVTSPIATLYVQTLMALMTRNAIILSPHPGAKGVSADAARMMMAAARAAGAPDGIIQVIEEPTDALIERLIADDRIDLVLATGGPAEVKAARRSGHPVFGGGPGNAPVLVDDSADIKLAARRIVASKSFDNSLLCTNESTLLAFQAIADELLVALQAEGAYICQPEECEQLRQLLFPPAGFNAAMMGQDADVIARAAGFNAPGAKILLTPVALVQPEEPLVREKLCPVLAFARVDGIGQAISCARSILRAAASGSSAAIHSSREATILAFAAALPALRVAVNPGCSLLSDNLAPHHLLQFARIAYNQDPTEVFGDFAGLDPLHLAKVVAAPGAHITHQSAGDASE